MLNSTTTEGNRSRIWLSFVFALLICTSFGLCASLSVLAQEAVDPKTEAAKMLYKIAYSSAAARDKFWAIFVASLDERAIAEQMSRFLEKAGFKNDRASKIAGERAAEIMIRFGEELGSISDPELEKATITLIERVLSAEEIKSLQSFYESPVGKKVLDDLPAAKQNAYANTLALVLPYVIKLAKESYEDIAAGPFPTVASAQPVTAERKGLLEKLFQSQADEVDRLIKEDLLRNMAKPKTIMQLSPAEKAMMDQKAIAEFDSWNAKINERVQTHKAALNKLPISALYLNELATELSSKFSDSDLKTWADFSDSSAYSKIGAASTEGLKIFAEVSAKKQNEVLSKLFNEVLAESR